MSSRALPEVSVVMAEYNTNPKYLKESIESILSQTYRNFELIIIDDGGAQCLDELIEGFNDRRIRLIVNDSNKGLAKSLNRGINESRGRYIVRMDTDDIAEPNRIELILSYIMLHPEYPVVGSRAIEFSGEKTQGIIGKAGIKDKKSIMRGDSLVHPSVIIDKDFILGVGLYPVDRHRAEDLALWLEMTLNGAKFYVLEDVLLRYRVNRDDYKKRKLGNRLGEIKVRLHYYPKLAAGPFEYLVILKSILAGVLPVSFVRSYRRRFVLDKDGLRNEK